jgi:hypothetical protein
MTFRVLLLLSFSLTACSTGKPPDSSSFPNPQHGDLTSKQTENGDRPKPVLVKGDGYVGVIFPADSKELPLGLYPKGASYWTPMEADISEAEKNLVPFLEKSKDRSAPEILKRIEMYKRQYRGIVLDGHKQIFINFFCETYSEDWKNEEMIAVDGGSCFFNLRFAIETMTFSDLEINGYA